MTVHTASSVKVFHGLNEQDLARQNAIDIRDNPAEHARQMEAIDAVEDFSVNHLGDD